MIVCTSGLGRRAVSVYRALERTPARPKRQDNDRSSVDTGREDLPNRDRGKDEDNVRHLEFCGIFFVFCVTLFTLRGGHSSRDQ